MPVIFLTENNSSPKKVLKMPFSAEPVSIFEVPFKKMKKRAIIAFREKIKESDALIFSNPELSSLVPERNADSKTLFNSVIVSILCEKKLIKKNERKRLIIYDPTESLIKSALSFFPDIALAGEGALLLSNRIYETTGASIPIVSGSSEKDIVICSKDCLPVPAKFVCGYNLETGKNSLGGNALKFYPKEIYSNIVTLMKRPLTLKEAALLSEYDKKATFNIAF